ncbi:MAG: hypothetical protein WCJ31_10365 [Planctomycetia bacterium]
MIRRCSPLLARARLALAAAACLAAAAFFFIRPSFAPATPPEGGPRLAGQAGLAGQAKLGTSAQQPTLARMLPVPGMLALTDGGIVVPLGWPQDKTAERGIPDGFEGQLIVAGRGNALSNCHGWVFTGGRYWIPIESVDTILNDNGYKLVPTPLADDLIVYRGDDGRPVHTGIVKAVGDDGFVLVESKWGKHDVFWHTRDQQAFGTRFEYWHADRDGHLLRLSSRTMPATRGPARGAVGG